MDYHVELIDMPVTVKATVVPNEDDSYTIFINARLNCEQQYKSFKHELTHLLNNDFKKNNVDNLEYFAHYI